jgi:hypothetical protein
MPSTKPYRILAVLLLAVLFVGAEHAPGSAGTQEGDLIRSHMQVVRNKRLDLGERQEAMNALLLLGTEGPRQLAAQVFSEVKKLRGQNEKMRKQLLASFEKCATGILKARLDRQAKKEIEEQRGIILQNARRGSLTKEQVVAESDPALAILEKLLVVTEDQVFEADEDIVEAHADLLQEMLDEVLLFEFWTLAWEALDRHPDGERIARRLKSPPDPAPDESRLFTRLDRILMLAMPMRDSDRKILEKNHALAAEIAATEAEGVFLLNLLRLRLGLTSLRLDPLLCEAARGHSKDMSDLGFFSHTSPVEGKETPGKRAALAGTSGSAENIAVGQSTADGAITAWWHSPGHHKNMLGGHARQGLGRHENHWTQMFGR